MTVHVADFVTILETLAPLHLSEEWDNSGLQVGDTDWAVEKVAIALEPSSRVVDYAISQGVDLLITHHPLIFKPLRSLEPKTPVGGILFKALEHKLAIYSTHTNFDKAHGGLNDILAERLGVIDLSVLHKPEETRALCKLVFYVPTEHKNAMLKALFQTTAGIVGDYTCCSFLCSGNGTYKPGEMSTPMVGQAGEIEVVEEVRIETLVDKSRIDGVIDHLKRHHPYETMAYDIYPLCTRQTSVGLGRLGRLADPLPLIEFAGQVKQKLGVQQVKVAGRPDRMVERVAICTGSGSSLLNTFFASGADVYLSGDLHYHDAMAVEERDLGLIDAGHFATEHIMAADLKNRLENYFSARNLPMDILVCPLEKDPFMLL